MRGIDCSDMRGPEVAPPETPPPELRWLDLDWLAIDDSYQRAIERTGRRNIEKIAAAFDWRCFAPLIVAQIGPSLYAIVDGQHRAHAARLAGQRSAPCAVIEADRRMQARAFAMINGETTRMSALAVHRAAVGAGEPEALALEACASAAGVRILGYPLAVDRMRNGDTTSPAALLALMRRYGAPTLEKALRAIMAGGRDARGLINPAVTRGLCAAITRLPVCSAGTIEKLFAAAPLADWQAKAAREAMTIADGICELALAWCARIAAQGRRG